MMATKRVKVNIASGYVALDDWINYDNSIVARVAKIPFLLKLFIKLKLLPAEYTNYLHKNLKIRDCRKKMPLRNKSVDFVYTSHFLEHLYRHEALKVLQDSYRVLKHNGRLRVVVPDVNKLINLYSKKQYEKLALEAKDENIPFVSADFLSLHFYPFENNKVKSPRFIQKIQELFLRRHKWMYDYNSMKQLLMSIGFADIQEKKCGESILGDIEKLDHHPEISLFIEAKKP